MRRKDYFIKRGSRYTFRLKVPIHLRAHLGKIEIRRAIGTTDHNLARMRAQRMAWITLGLFEAMQKNKNKINLSSQQISDHLNGWYDQMMELDLEVSKLIEQGLWDQTKANYQDSLDHIPHHLTELLEAIVDRGREPDRPDSDQPKVPTEDGRDEALLKAEGFLEWMGEESDTVTVLNGGLPSLDELEETQRRELLIAFLMKAVKVYNDKQWQQSGVTSGTTRAKQTTPSDTIDTPSVTYELSEAWDLYCTHQAAALATWQGNIPDTARLAFKDFNALYKGTFVHGVTRKQCTKFRDLQAAKPIASLDDYSNWSLEEIYERRKDIPDEDRRKGGRPQEIISQITKFFQWMVTDGMINRSYANDLKVLMIEGQPTRTWAKDDLDKLFSRDNLIGKSGIASQQSNQESLPLVMVLLLYTGARLDELCYVKTSDYFRRDPNSDGVIPTLIIQRSEERRIKTPFSIRKIPLHDHLAKLGILDYFEQRIVEGKKYLLDVPTKGGSKGNSLTQRFGSYRDNMGWKAGKGRSLRSFRKTINTALTGKSDSDDRYRMLGHSMGTVNDKNYTERLEISLDRIHSDLCGVTFGLDLDALRAVLERFVPNYPKRS